MLMVVGVENAPVISTEVWRNTRNSPVLSAVMDIIKGKAAGDAPELKPYLSRRTELSVQSGCLLCGRRVIIPSLLGKPVLQHLHSGQCGMVHMKEITQSYFWWPGLDGSIEEKQKRVPHLRRFAMYFNLHFFICGIGWGRCGNAYTST